MCAATERFSDSVRGQYNSAYTGHIQKLRCLQRNRAMTASRRLAAIARLLAYCETQTGRLTMA